jgi:hypothetical protein
MKSHPLVGQANYFLVLSFQSIVEILLEDEYEQKNGHREDGPASAHLVSACLILFSASANYLCLQSMYGLSSKDSDDVGVVEIDPVMAELRVWTYIQ